MKVAILEPYSLAAQAQLKAHPRVELVTDASAAEAVLIRSRTQIDRAFLDAAPTLQCVITATSGFDHVDWRECAKRGVIAAHTPAANAQSTAELTVGLMLAWERRIPAAYKNVRGGKWRDALARPHGLDGKTLGIVGLGRVGARVARVTHALGMKLFAYDPYIEADRFAEYDCERIGFTELLRSVDMVTLHVPLTKETKHLMNQPTLNEMQNEAVLINTCRGPVVDESDLMVALDDGVIAGAAMDVIEREPPPPGHRILTHPKLILTPHIGAFTERAWEKASAEAVHKLCQFAEGRSVADTLPLATPWFPHT
ncbi:MAG TPA: NAD(P)-dependent oxidoreductase [Bdellovibrionales bacterium]|nr:NAD(P)-dependent oxidoreductase [Bdellovibrionales bacterium]